jgi:multisubunit Na+/H+ antiporter MnhC subunit
MEDKVIIFIVATVVVTAATLFLALPALLRQNKAKTRTQDVSEKNKRIAK